MHVVMRFFSLFGRKLDVIEKSFEPFIAISYTYLKPQEHKMDFAKTIVKWAKSTWIEK